MSMNGQLVLEKQINQESDFKLNVSALTSGVYTLLLHLDNQKFHVQKFVVEW